MGIAGAAWATIIGQTLSAVVCLVKVLMIKDIIKIKPHHLILEKEIVLNICRLGLPNGVAQAIMFLATIIIQRLINNMGYLVTAAITAVLRVDAFAVIPSQTFNMSISTFTGQNIGAGQMDRVKQGNRTVLIMGLLVTTVMVGLMLIFGKWMIGLFTDTQELIDMGYSFICIMIPAYYFMTFGQSFGGVIRGAGDSMGPMWIALITNTVIRIPAAYIIAYLTISEINPAGHPATTFFAFVIALGLNCIATLVYYFKGPWKNKAVVGKYAHDKNK